MQFFSTDSVNNLYKHIRRYIPANPKLFSVFVSCSLLTSVGLTPLVNLNYKDLETDANIDEDIESIG